MPFDFGSNVLLDRTRRRLIHFSTCAVIIYCDQRTTSLQSRTYCQEEEGTELDGMETSRTLVGPGHVDYSASEVNGVKRRIDWAQVGTGVAHRRGVPSLARSSAVISGDRHLSRAVYGEASLRSHPITTRPPLTLLSLSATWFF